MVADETSRLTRRDLVERSAGVAALLGRHGVRPGGLVCLILPNSLALVLGALAAWRLGATILPLRWDLPAQERDRLLALAPPALVVGADGDCQAGVSASEVLAAGRHAGDPAELVAAPPWLVASGGSSGLPKLIDPGGDTLVAPAPPNALTFGPVHLVATPLFHTLGLAQLFRRLIEGHHVVLMEKFATERFLDVVEQERINSFSVVPTMVIRLLRSPTIGRRDLSSVTHALISAGATPEWAVREWIALLGPETVRLGYGSSEGLVATFIRGDEWLKRPGSVGRPSDVETMVVGEDGAPLPPGEAGELYFRPRAGSRRFRYLGDAEVQALAGGWVSVGDVGKLDADGYLYIVDRRTDMVKTGGSNVFVNEVEAALLAHPAVADVAVVGLPDPDWGQRVHAIVQLQGPADAATLRDHCKGLLAAYKAPRSIEFVDDLGRGEAGKLNRAPCAKPGRAEPPRQALT